MDDYYAYFYGPMGGYRPRRGRGGAAKKKKPIKPKKDNWFLEINNDELRQLCKACKLPHTGNKSDLVNRLLADDFAEQFAPNQRSTMINVKGLKNMCRERFLQVSGTKFELIHRIMQHERGTGGDSLKRATSRTAGNVKTVIDPITGETKEVLVAKKRKSSTMPNPKTFYNRIQKKIKAVLTEKKYDSNLEVKRHGPHVEKLMAELANLAHQHLFIDPELVGQCYCSIILSFIDEFDLIQGKGNLQEIESIVQMIQKDVGLMRHRIKPDTMERLCNLMPEMKVCGDDYGILSFYDMDAAVKEMRGQEKNNKDDHQKKRAGATFACKASPSNSSATSGTDSLASSESDN